MWSNGGLGHQSRYSSCVLVARQGRAAGDGEIPGPCGVAVLAGSGTGSPGPYGVAVLVSSVQAGGPDGPGGGLGRPRHGCQWALPDEASVEFW